MSNQELISIVVPVYNVREYLDNCIRSIVNQTYRNIEIILVDDGSTDESSEECDKWESIDSRIVVIHQKNGGLSAARNKGIQYAKGIYVCFVDSDDYIASDMIEKLYFAIVKNSVEMAISGYYECIGNKLVSHNFHEKKIIKPIDFFDSLFEGMQIGSYAWNKMYKRELFSDISFPIGQKYEDINTTYKLIAKCKRMVVIPDCLYYYVRHEGSITTSINPKSMWDLLKAITEREKYIKEYYPELSKKVDNQKVCTYISSWNQLAKEGNKEYQKDMYILRTYIIKNYKKIINKKYLFMGWLIRCFPWMYEKIIFLLKK